MDVMSEAQNKVWPADYSPLFERQNQLEHPPPKDKLLRPVVPESKVDADPDRVKTSALRASKSADSRAGSGELGDSSTMGMTLLSRPSAQTT